MWSSQIIFNRSTMWIYSTLLVFESLPERFIRYTRPKLQSAPIRKTNVKVRHNLFRLSRILSESLVYMTSITRPRANGTAIETVLDTTSKQMAPEKLRPKISKLTLRLLEQDMREIIPATALETGREWKLTN